MGHMGDDFGFDDFHAPLDGFDGMAGIWEHAAMFAAQGRATLDDAYAQLRAAGALRGIGGLGGLGGLAPAVNGADAVPVNTNRGALNLQGADAEMVRRRGLPGPGADPFNHRAFDPRAAPAGWVARRPAEAQLRDAGSNQGTARPAAGVPAAGVGGDANLRDDTGNDVASATRRAPAQEWAEEDFAAFDDLQWAPERLGAGDWRQAQVGERGLGIGAALDDLHGAGGQGGAVGAGAAAGMQQAGIGAPMGQQAGIGASMGLGMQVRSANVVRNL